MVLRPKIAWRLLFPALWIFLIANGIREGDGGYFWASLGPLLVAVGAWSYKITLTSDGTLRIRRPPRRQGVIALSDIHTLSIGRQDAVRRLPLVVAISDASSNEISFETWFWSRWRSLVGAIAAKLDMARINVDVRTLNHLERIAGQTTPQAGR
jgi:hypothetical protein